VHWGIRPGALVLVILLVGVGACAKTPSQRPRTSNIPQAPVDGTSPRIPERIQEGIASWYGPNFHGKPTSSGETYDMYQMTAAHQTLPLGTRVSVTNLENHRTAEVTINDRGPFVKDRIIDLSYSAARVLDVVGPGTARVRLEILEGPPGGSPADFSVKPFYVLQLGAFNDRANAQALLTELDGLLGRGNARVAAAKLGSQEIYRVRVGRHARREEAQSQAQALAQRGYVVLVMTEYP
jgi:rare lipoprotein A